MSSDQAVVTGLAGRYATALFALAKDSKVIEEVAGELDALKAQAAENAELSLLMSSPRIGNDEKVKAIQAVAESAGVSDLTTKFLGTLAQNGRLAALGDVADAFGALLAQHKGELTAQVTSAKALTKTQLDALKTKLKAGLGRDVAVQASVDEELLGGLVVRVGSKMIDSSLRSKLDRLEIAMKGAG